MTARFPVEEVEGIGITYGARLRANGIRTLSELRRTTVEDIHQATRGGRGRAQVWKNQAWLMVTGMSKHVAEVIVSAGVARTLWELATADPDDIVAAVQQAQNNPEFQINKIPDRERIDITRSLAERWRQAALSALNFKPSNPPPVTTTKVDRASISATLEKAVDIALGDIPSVASEDLLKIRDQLVDACRNHILTPPTDEDEAHVHQMLADQPLLLADELLKYLRLWPAGTWLRHLALRETIKTTHFAIEDPERIRRELFRGISPSKIRALLSAPLDRELRSQGLEALFAVSDALQRSLSDPGLPALGGCEGGLADLDGAGVQLGLVGHGWDRTHPAFATAALRSDDAPVPNSPWIGLDTAVLSQIAAKPLPAQETIARPALGPAGIAPSAQITLFAAKSTGTALASAIDQASAASGADTVLLVPRTCVGIVRGPGVYTLVDLPLPANPEIHAALLRAREAGLVVIVPAGIGGRNLANLPIDDLLVDPVGSPPTGFFPVIGPAAEPGVAARLAECTSAGVLIVGTSSPWSNRGAGIIRVPDIPFTVAGGTERVVAGAGFTAGWHGPHAAAATAAGLAALSIQATMLLGGVVTVEPIRNLLQRYTAPSWATVPKRLATRGIQHTAGICAFGVATGDTLKCGKPSTHNLSAATLLTSDRDCVSVPTRLTSFRGSNADLAWSPDGAKIVFRSTRDADSGEIYVMNADGSNVTRLTHDSAWYHYPVWSPDGTKIVFTSVRDGNQDIYMMDADGSNVTNLTNNSAVETYPVWSPDGTKIVFTSVHDGNYEIYVVDTDGSNVTNLTNTRAFDAAPAWSPDGTKIAFHSWRDGNEDIYVMNADGSNVTRLTHNNAYDSGPVWSPDGTKILFTSTRDGNEDIYVMNADGSNVTRLTHNGAVEAWPHPTWSPDGAKIAFASHRDDIRQIYVMNADGSNVTRLTNARFHSGGPIWSPNSEKILFLSLHDHTWQIYVMNVNK